MRHTKLSIQKRRRAYWLGHTAEYAAMFWLTCRGYRILARRYKTPRGEIDLIARQGKTIAVIEVKARLHAFEADVISPYQQQRIIQGCALFLAKHPKFAHYTIRFDAMCFSLTGWPRHLRNAWQSQ